MRSVFVCASLASFAALSVGDVGAQPWRAGERWRGPHADDVRCFGAERVLPAGVYFRRVGRYEQRLPCPAPAVAVVAGVHADDRAATRALASAARLRDLAPGYPWAVETRDLSLDAAPGVAVVLGLFERTRDARAWIDARSAGDTLQIVSVARDVAGGTQTVPAVTQVIGRARVAAYTAAAVARIESALERSDDEATSGVAFAQRTARATRGVRPACSIAPGSVFTNLRYAYDVPGFTVRGVRAWHAVRCPNGVDAWVPLAATQATSVVWTHRDGLVRVTQISLVECDSPTLTTWRVGADGERIAWRREMPGGC